MPCRVRPLFVVAVLAAVLCAGCQVDGRVTISADRSGAGTVNVRVVLDAEAVAQVGDVGTALRLDDLRASGWTVDPPLKGSDGITLNASKRFGRPGDLQSVLDEVGGRGNVFRTWTLKVEDRFASTGYVLGGSVHLSGGVDQFSDRDVATALDGLPVGRTPDELAKALGPDRDRIKLTVRAEVPDSASSEQVFTIGDGTAHDSVIVASDELTDASPWRWFILGGACLLIAALLVVVPRVRRDTPAPE